MADEPVQPTPEPVPNTGSPPAPVVPSADATVPVGEGPESRSDAAPSEAPAQPTPTEPLAETPVEPAPPVETKPTDVPEAKPSVLSEAVAAQPEEPPEAPHYEPFTMPEGFRVSDESLAPFIGFLGEAKLSQEQGQRLMDLHAAEIQRLQEQMAESQQRTFDTMREGWREQFEKDPDLGGNRRQTTINSVVGLIRHFASDADHLRRTLQVLDYTGAGDHPDVIRLLANAAKGMAPQYREGVPVSAGRPAPQQTSRYRQRYAASSNGSAS